MKNYFVTRHSGAREWAESQHFPIDEQVEHFDITILQPGDRVIGTLPIQLAAAVCELGAEYWHLVLTIPPELRGRELSAAQLDECGAKLMRYQVTEINQ